MDLDLRVPELSDHLSLPLQKRVLELSSELINKISFDYLKKKAKPNERIELLRAAFWVEYERSCVQDRKVQATNVYDGICNRDQWYDIISNDVRLAYIITPTAKYEARIQIILQEKAVPIVNEILDAPMTTKDGLLDVDIANLKVRVLRQLEYRLKGTPIQRTETKEFRVTASVDNESRDDMIKRMEHLDQQLSAITKQKNYVEWKKDMDIIDNLEEGEPIILEVKK